MAYITLFPIGTTMRANLFVYRDMDDPLLRRMRTAPTEALAGTACRACARLLGDFEVPQPVKIRPVDLYVTSGHRQAGVVLVGDAFATSCPAAGTGCNKVFTDVERLCNVHIPRWLASAGMGEDKIADFYDDEVKVDCDAASTAKAYYLRSLSTETGLDLAGAALGPLPRSVGRGIGPAGAGPAAVGSRPQGGDALVWHMRRDRDAQKRPCGLSN